MTIDPLLLSTLQFIWVVAWHILLPAFTVVPASYIANLEALHLATGQAIYQRVSKFWIRIFAVTFGMGVASGITRQGPGWSTVVWSAVPIGTPSERGV